MVEKWCGNGPINGSEMVGKWWLNTKMVKVDRLNGEISCWRIFSLK